MEATPTILSISVVAAMLSIWRTHVISRKRATVDLVLAQKNDEVLNDAKDKLKELHASKQDCFAKYAANDQSKTEEAKAILTVLNNYEFIASGIKQKAFDEKLYKLMLYGVLVRDYDALKGFVHQIRETRSHKTLFQEFEWIGKRWKKKPLKTNSKDQ